MSTKTIKLRRGAAAAAPVLADGEPAFYTDTFELYVGYGGTNRQIGGSGVFQPLDSDLTAIAALNSTGFARQAGAGSWSIVGESGSGNVVRATSPTITTPTISGAVVFPSNVRQNFNPGATFAGINIGSHAGPPGTPAKGDLVYDSSTDEILCYLNASWVSLGAGGGGSGTVNSGTDKRIAYYAGTGTTVDDATGFEYQSGASPNVLITAQNAAYVALKLKMAASPSANPLIITNSSDTNVAYITPTGHAFVSGGTSTSMYAAVSTIWTDYAAGNNSGTSETDLYTHTVPANTFATDGDSIAWTIFGINDSTGSNRQFRVYFDGTLIVDTGAITGLQSTNWWVYITVVRTSSTHAMVSAFITSNNNLLIDNIGVVDVTVANFTAGRVLKITGQTSGLGAGSNQITAYSSIGQLCPVA